MYNLNVEQETLQLPLIPLREMVAFPDCMITLNIGRDRSIASLQKAVAEESKLFVVCQRDGMVDQPGYDDLYRCGTIVEVKHVMHMPDSTVRALVKGISRALLMNVYSCDPHRMAEIAVIKEEDYGATLEDRAKLKVVRDLIEQLTQISHHNMPEFSQAIDSEQKIGAACDLIAANVIESAHTQQMILEAIEPSSRLDAILAAVSNEIKITALEEKIHAKVRETMDKSNHEYYLREQIHAIQDELGEDDDEEIHELRMRLLDSPMPEEAREKVEKELKRLSKMTIHAPEAAVSQNYIEYMLELPWGVRDKMQVDIKKARRVLEADHYGLKDVKQRLLEYLAIRLTVKENMSSPIICLVGPPGVGKTSIAHSVADALGRKFTRMSLGGVHDEAEIRGHRKTYVGAMPGRIIAGIEQVNTMNPVFLLDEIDKLSHDMRGDPASALLEVLDPEQNKTFTDHYLEAPFDLSDVLFITTANTTDTIDRALLDRMEVIEVESYTLEEKVQIGKKHLMPKQLKANGLTSQDLKITEKAIERIIEDYTREAGVRNLERLFSKLCRKVALERLETEQTEGVSLRPQHIQKYLGAPKYMRQNIAEQKTVGLVNGLAWTSVGGEVMPVEAAVFQGKGAILLTGQLGDVMKESAELARSNVRTMLTSFGLSEDYFEKHDVHIHVPEGAVPKDGPSAGVALTCALLSAVTGKPADGGYAMTGEITLHGRVLPIGGVKEKLLAALRMGVNHILLPAENEKDLEKIDPELLGRFEITFIKHISEATSIILASENEQNGADAAC